MKTIIRLGLLGSVVYLIWAAMAVLDGRWLLVAILTVLWLLSLGRSAYAGLAGFGVALYQGEPWPAVAFALLVAGRVAPEVLPLWALRRRTDAEMLLSAVNAVDPQTRGVLVTAAHGGPISTVTLAAAAAAEAPQYWEGGPGTGGVQRWDGPLLVDSGGVRWTAHAAEAVVLADRLAAAGVRTSTRQTLGTAALLVPEAALVGALPHPSNAFETATRITGFNLDDLGQVLTAFLKSPAGADAMRRVELRVTVDEDGSVPAEKLFTANNRQLWTLVLAMKFALPLALLAAAGEGIGTVLRAPRRRRAAEPAAGTRNAPAHLPAPPASFVRSGRRSGRIAAYLAVSAELTSWPGTVALRLLRPLCTLVAAGLALTADLPWWQRVLLAVGVLLVRPVRRWWLDIVLAAGAAVTGLWAPAVVLLLRGTLTAAVILPRGAERAVASVRRELVSSMTGRPHDRIPTIGAARARYIASLRSDEGTDAGVAEYLVAAWSAGDALVLWAALVGAVRIEVFGVLPAGVPRRSMIHQIGRLAVLEGTVGVVPRIVTAIAAAVTAGVTAPAGALLTDPIRVPDAWVAGAGAAVLAWLAVRRRPTAAASFVLGGALLLWLGTTVLPALAVVLLGAGLGWVASRSFERRTLNVPPRLSWVGRRVTGVRRHAAFQAASVLESTGRAGVAIDVLTGAVTATRDTQPAAAAVALAHCALIECDRGNLQPAVEHAEAARALAGGTRSATVEAVASYASGVVQFTIGDHRAAEKWLVAAEPKLRRRPEGGSCAAVLAQVYAALGRPDESMAAAGRTAARFLAPGQLPLLLESQVAAGWAMLRAGQPAVVRGLIEEVLNNFENPLAMAEAEPDERTRYVRRRLIGEACLLLGRTHLAQGEPVAAEAVLDRAAGHLRPTAATDLLGMTRIYIGQCQLRQGRWTEARSSVTAGVELLESRRGQLRTGAHRASAVVSGTDHYEAALDVLVHAQHHGDAGAGMAAAGLIESLRRNALATTLRDERSAFIDRFPADALAVIDDIARRESALERAGDGDEAERVTELRNELENLRRRLEDTVSRGFAEAYLPEKVDYRALSAVARQGHILQFEVLETRPDRWRGYRVWVPPHGTPWVDEVTIADPVVLDVLTAVRRDDHVELLFQEFDETASVWAAIAAALLPLGLLVELGSRPANDPVRLLIVPGEHLAYLPWPSLLLDNADHEALLLHKAVIQIVPSLNLLQPSTASEFHGATLAYLDDEIRGQIARGGDHAEPWRRLSTTLPVVLVGSRNEFEQRLSDPRIDSIYLAAHGEGTGLDQSITFTDGGKLTAGAALRYRWPRSLVFASCLLAKVDQQTGREPFGLVIACMLGGCRTVVAGVIKVERRATSEICTDVSLALAVGADPATALRDAQRAYIEREGGAIFLTEWGGLICISTEWRPPA